MSCVHSSSVPDRDLLVGESKLRSFSLRLDAHNRSQDGRMKGKRAFEPPRDSDPGSLVGPTTFVRCRRSPTPLPTLSSDATDVCPAECAIPPSPCAVMSDRQAGHRGTSPPPPIVLANTRPSSSDSDESGRVPGNLSGDPGSPLTGMSTASALSSSYAARGWQLACSWHNNGTSRCGPTCPGRESQGTKLPDVPSVLPLPNIQSALAALPFDTATAVICPCGCAARKTPESAQTYSLLDCSWDIQVLDCYSLAEVAARSLDG
jgi:hypothetical protein